MKKMKTILLIFVAILVVLFLGKNAIANMAVSRGVKAITGLTLNIKSLSVGVFRSALGIKELTLFNPSGFKEKVMVDMPELYVNYDLGAFLKGKVHLEEVRLNLKELTVIKNEKGQLNLDSLKVVQAQKEQKGPSQRKEKAKAPEIRIDLLELSIGKVIYKDYSRGTPPQVTEFDVNIREKYENISNPYVLGSLILTRALFKTQIARLANFDVRGLETGLTDAVKKYSGALTDTVSKTAFTTKGMGKEVAGSAKQAVGDTADALKKIFPFGNK